MTSAHLQAHRHWEYVAVLVLAEHNPRCIQLVFTTALQIRLQIPVPTVAVSPEVSQPINQAGEQFVTASINQSGIPNLGLLCVDPTAYLLCADAKGSGISTDTLRPITSFGAYPNIFAAAGLNEWIYVNQSIRKTASQSMQMPQGG